MASQDELKEQINCNSENTYSEDKEYDEYETWQYRVGDDMDFLPREAVYSVQIELREIKKLDESFVMTVAVRDPDTGEYQIFTEKVAEGSELSWDGLEPGVACFAGPDRVAVKLTVTEVSETRISFLKEYDDEE